MYKYKTNRFHRTQQPKTETQAGLRTYYPIAYHIIFTLYTRIDLYLNKLERMYCACVDYAKAFDMISHKKHPLLKAKENLLKLLDIR